VAWYENVAGDGSTWTARSVSTDLSGAVSVFPADLDRDGDQDVLAAWLLSDAVAWHENTDGLGSTWLTHEITTSALGAHFVVAADVDGDGWTDSISSSRSDDTVAWYPARSLVARRSALSLAGGGTQVLTLEAGTGAAGWFAWVLGSVTGTSPGLTLGGAHLPLNPDFWFGFTLTKPFAGVFGGFLAPLDANGTGTATFSLPAGLDPNLAGVVFHHAFVASAAFGDVDFASTPVRLELLP
jgi:hypothetical protein